MFSWGDLWGALPGILNMGGQGMDLGMKFYGMFNQPKMPQMPSGPPTQQMPTWEPPDFSGLFEGFAEQMEAQQEAFKQEQQKEMIREAAGRRKNMQARGITWDPNNPEAGAGGYEALAAEMGIPLEEFLAALGVFGKEFGFTGEA